jgi:hypothetical protein
MVRSQRAFIAICTLLVVTCASRRLVAPPDVDPPEVILEPLEAECKLSDGSVCCPPMLLADSLMTAGSWWENWQVARADLVECQGVAKADVGECLTELGKAKNDQWKTMGLGALIGAALTCLVWGLSK